ncbi:sigma factor-like helix-turn-helix DNA-binding protein [Kitasatospora sp. NPDC001175]|uniref:sigma factor-like helix-turn-helix DNA-binding protein n=1 Tax=Kitasatospora sp. NPDC001175 TaxID=3157103 RepID=UPI003CFE4169
MEPTPAELTQTAIDHALAMDDPAQRARAITGILDVIKTASPQLQATRRADVLKLRETLTLREIGERIGLSIGRVDQIAKGATTGRRAKAKADQEAEIEVEPSVGTA